MKKIYFIFLLLAFASCKDVTGSDVNSLPSGPFVVWFNGLSGNADGYFINQDSLITNCWTCGSAPNQIIEYSSGRFAILSSMDSEIRFFSGLDYSSLALPEGSNPYCLTTYGNLGYATLLLSGEIVVFDITANEVEETFSVRSNPSGITLASSKLFVGSGNYPESSSPGGVSIISPDDGTEIKWLDTGVNTNWLEVLPTGNVHAYSTTYQGDGAISIIDPESMQISAVVNCGGAPSAGIMVNDYFLSPDGWGEGGIIKYYESGDFSRISLPFSPTNLTHYGECLYTTSFASNMVYILDSSTYQIIDSLEAGGEGPQGVIAITPEN